MSDPIAVLGMHRSGTSFLVRTLNLAGLWLGATDDLSTVEGRAMIGNPKGNYENRGSIAINDFILARSGGAWNRPAQTLQSDLRDEDRMRAFCAALESGMPTDALRWGWKDPRTVLTLDAWIRALKRNIFIVASFRHPSAVARSLLARDRLPLQYSYALWAHYNALLIGHLESFPHVLVRFDVGRDELLDRVEQVCDATGLRTGTAAAISWYEPALIRSRPDPTDEALNRQIEPLWSRLLDLYQGQTVGGRKWDTLDARHGIQT
jgi:hypothetical protein